MAIMLNNEEYKKALENEFKYELPKTSGTATFNGETRQWECTETDKNINNPPHYNKHPSGIECIQITRHMNFNLGNAVKYIWRADLKNDAIEDLKKAAWYIQDEIQRREKK